MKVTSVHGYTGLLFLSRFVFDSWLEIKIQSAEEAEELLSSVVQLRAAWDMLIALKLKGLYRIFIEDGSMELKIGMPLF